MAGEAKTQRLVDVRLDEKTLVRRKPEVEHERAIAIYDLLEENYFCPAGDLTGPFRLVIRLEENRLLLDIGDQAGVELTEVALPMTPFRTIIKDYFLICESYYSAITRSSPSQIEAIDMGRRGIHDEGSRTLQERLKGKVRVDFETARRLFTLISVLHWKG